MSFPDAMITKMIATKEFVSKNHWSTSVSPSGAFGGNARITIKQHSGLALQRVSLFPSEREVLMPAGIRFKVTSVRKVGGVYHISMSEMKR